MLRWLRQLSEFTTLPKAGTLGGESRDGKDGVVYDEDQLLQADSVQDHPVAVGLLYAITHKETANSCFFCQNV